jgi:hypothetical protein
MFLWNHLSMQEQYGEAGICGLHGSWDIDPDNAEPSNRPNIGLIPQNVSYTVMHKLGLSVLSSGRLIPTRYMPLELELHLNPTISDYLYNQYQTADGATVALSTNFTLQNIQLLYDAYIVDEAVQESFYKSLLSNRVLSIPTMTVYQVVQSIPAGSTSFSFSAVNAFSRLSHVWLTFRNTGPRTTECMCPTAASPGRQGAMPQLLDIAPSARLSLGPHLFQTPSGADDPGALLPIPEGAPGHPEHHAGRLPTRLFHDRI